MKKLKAINIRFKYKQKNLKEEKMLIKIADNIYKKIAPLPKNPLKEINVYIITGEKNLVIDTGFNRKECENSLNEAFEQLGIKKADLLITHLHADHCGLACKFQESGSKIYVSKTDGDIINGVLEEKYWNDIEQIFLKHGFPKAKEGKTTDCHPGKMYCNENTIDFTYVKEGDVLEYGGYKLKIIETPGHTAGHISLYDEEEKILFCGDHILGDITPNICIEVNFDNPLKSYFDSLEKVRHLDVGLLLTAHRKMVDNMYDRIEELYKHHDERLSEVLKIIGTKEKSAYTIAQDMNWSINCKNWDDFPLPQKWFATGEAIAHLQYLYFKGKLNREEKNGIYYFSLI